MKSQHLRTLHKANAHRLAMLLILLLVTPSQITLIKSSKIQLKETQRGKQQQSKKQSKVFRKFPKNNNSRLLSKQLSDCKIPKCAFPDRTCSYCLKCDEHYHPLFELDNKLRRKDLCVKKLSNCSTYSLDGSCKECEKDFFLLPLPDTSASKFSNTIIATPENSLPQTICSKCLTKSPSNDKCLSCSAKEELFLVNGLCVRLPYCAKANEKGNCIECKNGFFLDSNSGIGKCYKNQEGCLTNLVVDSVPLCSRCDAEFLNFDNKCYRKLMNCEIHELVKDVKCPIGTDPAFKCLVCSQGFEVDFSGRCQQSKCAKEVKGFCEQCVSGYELVEESKTCRKQIVNCKKDNNHDGICLSCNEGFAYYNFNCVKEHHCKVFTSVESAVKFKKVINTPIKLFENKAAATIVTSTPASNLDNSSITPSTAVPSSTSDVTVTQPTTITETKAPATTTVETVTTSPSTGAVAGINRTQSIYRPNAPNTSTSNQSSVQRLIQRQLDLDQSYRRNLIVNRKLVNRLNTLTNKTSKPHNDNYISYSVPSRLRGTDDSVAPSTSTTTTISISGVTVTATDSKPVDGSPAASTTIVQNSSTPVTVTSNASALVIKTTPPPSEDSQAEVKLFKEKMKSKSFSIIISKCSECEEGYLLDELTGMCIKKEIRRRKFQKSLRKSSEAFKGQPDNSIREISKSRLSIPKRKHIGDLEEVIEEFESENEEPQNDQENSEESAIEEENENSEEFYESNGVTKPERLRGNEFLRFGTQYVVRDGVLIISEDKKNDDYFYKTAMNSNSHSRAFIDRIRDDANTSGNAGKNTTPDQTQSVVPPAAASTILAKSSDTPTTTVTTDTTLTTAAPASSTPTTPAVATVTTTTQTDPITSTEITLASPDVTTPAFFSPTIPNCVRVDNQKCKKCVEGFVLSDSGTCLLPNSLLMSSSDSCFRCKLGFFLNKEQCVSCADLSDDSILPAECNICTPNKRVSLAFVKFQAVSTSVELLSNVCTRKIKNCSVYAENDTCLVCAAGFVLSSDGELCFDSSRISLATASCYEMVDNVLIKYFYEENQCVRYEMERDLN